MVPVVSLFPSFAGLARPRILDTDASLAVL